MGDHWQFGQGISSDIPGLEWLARSFVIASAGGGALARRFYINSDGLVSVMDGGSFYSPAINTPSLQINGTNISQLYQSKADMANYIN